MEVAEGAAAGLAWETLVHGQLAKARGRGCEPLCWPIVNRTPKQWSGCATRFSRQPAEKTRRRKKLDTLVPRVQQAMRQAKQRIFGGNTHVADRLSSCWLGAGLYPKTEFCAEK
jgi:hypothetical protein